MIEKLNMIYIGPIAVLKDKVAMVHYSDDGKVTAQFDDMSLDMEYTHAWVQCDAADFRHMMSHEQPQPGDDELVGDSKVRWGQLFGRPRGCYD